MPPSATVTAHTNGAVPQLSLKANATKTDTTNYEVSENYEGKYQFAPIEEAQVTRAMIKRSVLSFPRPPPLYH